MESIIPRDRKGVCFICDRVCDTHKHHIFGGANRKHSESYGLFIHLCPDHHNMTDNSVHFDKAMMEACHILGQQSFEADYRKHFNNSTDEDARKAFMKIFGRNYL